MPVLSSNAYQELVVIVLTLKVTVCPTLIVADVGLTVGIEGEVQLTVADETQVKFSAAPEVCAVTVTMPPGYNG
jgi:hypothetical protein